MKRFTTIAAVVFALIAVLQLVRLVLRWEVVVDGVIIPMWASVIAVIVSAALSIMLFREARR